MKQILSFIIFIYSSFALGKESNRTLPKGRSVFHNAYVKSTEPLEYKYDREGDKSSFYDRYQFDISGASISKINPDIAHLIDTLNTFDIDGVDGENIDLGSISVEGESNIWGNVVVYARGITDIWTLGIAIPYIKATSNTKIKYHAGNSNIGELKGKYGNLNVDLDDAFNKLEQVDEQVILKEVDKVIENSGYQPLGYWEYAGLSDIMLVSRLNLWEYGSWFRLGIQNDVSFPTGYQDDPTILNDTSLSRETITTEAKLSVNFNYWWLSWHSDIGARYFFSNNKDVRFNETGEDIVPRGRENVRFQPGTEITTFHQLGITFWQTITPYIGYRIRNKGKTEYFSDDERISKLGDATGYTTKSYKVGFNIDTAKLFLKKKFFIPMFAEVSYEEFLGASNVFEFKILRFDLGLYF